MINKLSLIKIEYLLTDELNFDQIGFTKNTSDQFMKYFYELIEGKYDFSNL